MEAEAVLSALNWKRDTTITMSIEQNGNIQTSLRGRREIIHETRSFGIPGGQGRMESFSSFISSVRLAEISSRIIQTFIIKYGPQGK